MHTLPEFYIYAYLRSDLTPYYIGKGRGNRAWSKDHVINLPLDTSKIIIMESGLTELGALALERRYIRWYGRKDNGTGILRNRTDGGDGSSGLIQSDEAKRKISNAMIGNTIWRGMKLSDDHKRKISDAKRGRKHSDETRRKISESRQNKKLNTI